MRKRQSLTLSLLVGGLLIAAPLVAQAGGTIKGKVTFKGKEQVKEFELIKFPNTTFCAKNKNVSEDKKTRILHELTLSKDGGLVGAIVAVRDIQDKKWVKAFAGTDMHTDICEFLPYTSATVNSKKAIKILNNDADPDDPGKDGNYPSKLGVLHNPHGFGILEGITAPTLFNKALAKKGDTLELDTNNKFLTQNAGGVVRVQCDQHEFMQSWLLPVENPYYATANTDGTFEIKDVPAGKHTLLAWHPYAGDLEIEVDVPEGGTVEANIEVKEKHLATKEYYKANKKKK